MDERFCDTRTTARRAGVCPRTVRNWVQDPMDPLPAYRVHGKLLFDWDEVARWIKRHRVETEGLDRIVAEVEDYFKKESERD